MNFARAAQLDIRAADLQTLVVNMTEFVAHALGPRMILRVHRQDVALMAMIRVHAVEQAIVNLLINARDACRGEGLIDSRFCVQATPHAEDEPAPGSAFASISISDNGPGMSEDIRARLFEPQFTTKASGKGTGLGSAQGYGLMLQLGGQMSVVSGPGQGATFARSFCAA